MVIWGHLMLENVNKASGVWIKGVSSAWPCSVAATFLLYPLEQVTHIIKIMFHKGTSLKIPASPYTVQRAPGHMSIHVDLFDIAQQRES